MLLQGHDKTSSRKMRIKVMTEAARKAKNAYSREYAKNNPEKIKGYMDKYWEKKAAAAATDEQGSLKG